MTSPVFQGEGWGEVLNNGSKFRRAREAAAPLDASELVARTELFRTPDGYVVALLRAEHSLDPAALCQVLDVPEIEPVPVEERALLFPDVEPGIIPPFGSHYGVRTIMDIHLLCGRSIVVPGSSAGVVIRMSLPEFTLLEHPIAAAIVCPSEAWTRTDEPLVAVL